MTYGILVALFFLTAYSLKREFDMHERSGEPSYWISVSFRIGFFILSIIFSIKI